MLFKVFFKGKKAGLTATEAVLKQFNNRLTDRKLTQPF